MNQNNETNLAGRKALFTGTTVPTTQEPSIRISEVADVIRHISERDEICKDTIPSLYEPVVNKITSLTTQVTSCTDECNKLENQILGNNKDISELQVEKEQLVAERNLYLNDLITSHTEFDRALEIFQYHEVPMVLTGPDRTVHDANDVFCTLFSIARSEITTSHPPLANWFPDDNQKITGPDNEEYFIISLSPPIVPFDHEAISLVLLIPSKHLIQDINTEPAIEIDEPIEPKIVLKKMDPVSLAFNQFPIPAVIINQYRIIIFCNTAFCRLVARAKEAVIFRDIGSIGIKYKDADCISQVFSDNESCQCEAIITHLDGDEIPGYFEITPLWSTPDEPSALILGVALVEEPIKIAEKPSEDILIRMLLDLNPSAAALLDDNARVISANEGFSEMTGLSPKDLNGTDVRDLGIAIPDVVLVAGATEVQYLPDTIRIQSAWGMQESSGMVVPVGASGSGITGILIIQPLSQSISPVDHFKSESVIPIQKPGVVDIDAIPVPHLVTDVSGKIIKVNEAFILLSGYQTDEILGRFRKDVLISETSDLVRLVLPGGEFRLREIVSSKNYEDGELGFWYCNLTPETQKISQFQECITTLEEEIQTLKNQQVSSIQSHDDRISADEIDIVEFELNEELYAIDITMVREVMEMLPITPLPRTPPYVCGIINLRGEVTHVIDLAILLGERPKNDRSGQKIIIIPSDVTNGEHVGIIVDNVHSVTEILGRHISHLGDDVTTQIQTHIKGIIKISHDDVLEKRAEINSKTTLVIWLDIQKILHDIQGSI
ncbi:MAG: chemotaxis protein CheW [Methanobacteriota archaeon]